MQSVAMIKINEMTTDTVVARPTPSAPPLAALAGGERPGGDGGQRGGARRARHLRPPVLLGIAGPARGSGRSAIAEGGDDRGCHNSNNRLRIGGCGYA